MKIDYTVYSWDCFRSRERLSQEEEKAAGQGSVAPVPAGHPRFRDVHAKKKGEPYAIRPAPPSRRLFDLLEEGDLGRCCLLLTDLHSAEGEMADALVDGAMRLKPEEIFIGGDLINWEVHPAYDQMLGLLKRLRQIAPVYCVPGNHEIKCRAYSEMRSGFSDFLKRCREADICWLWNKRVRLSSGIWLYGLALPLSYYTRGETKPLSVAELTNLLGKPEGENPILLTHNPIYFDQYAAWGAALCLCGHNHGGLIRLPGVGGLISPQLRLFPKYDYGYFLDPRTGGQMILSRGLWGHGVNPRFFNNAPEVVVIRLVDGSGL